MSRDDSDYILGKISGIYGVLGALMTQIPDKKALFETIDQITEGLIGVSTPMPLSEKFLEGQHQAIKDLKQIASSLIV